MADLLSAISVLLVFLTFLLNGLQKQVDDFIAAPKPPAAQTISLEKFNRNLLKLFWLKAVPVTLVFSLIFYTLLPKSIHLLTDSHINFWDFDELNTLFLFIETGVLGLAIFAIVESWQLLKKYWSS